MCLCRAVEPVALVAVELDNVEPGGVGFRMVEPVVGGVTLVAGVSTWALAFPTVELVAPACTACGGYVFS